CHKSFTRRYNLDAHLRAHYNVKPFACTADRCNESFIRKHDLIRHMASVHQRKSFGPCPWCGRCYSRGDS
ncbi:hypothetical protein BC831DRAFT_390428, partial [Entophlyctis helioformis]